MLRGSGDSEPHCLTDSSSGRGQGCLRLIASRADRVRERPCNPVLRCIGDFGLRFGSVESSILQDTLQRE